ADRQVAKILNDKYHRGVLTFPSWSFFQTRDNNLNTFLHTAAAEGRSDLIRWASEQICAPGSWEEDEYWLWNWPGWLIERGQRGFQTFIGDLGLPNDLVFNQQESESGRTALHVALEHW